jgi:hypothetical protein
MTLIGSKRLQQGVFEALASSNRAAGSGGGSGLFPAPQTTANTLLGQAINSVGFTVITGSPIQFTLGRPTTLMAIGYVLMNWTAGGLTSVLSPFVDGVQEQGLAVGPAATIASPANVPICYSALLGPGTHTVDIRVTSVNLATTYNVQAFSLSVILFG